MENNMLVSFGSLIKRFFSDLAQLGSYGVDWINTHVGGDWAAGILVVLACIALQIVIDLRSDKLV